MKTIKNARLAVLLFLEVVVIVYAAYFFWTWARNNGVLPVATKVFTKSGTWVKPAGVTDINLLVKGGDTNDASKCNIEVDVRALGHAAMTINPYNSSFVGDNGIVYCSLTPGVDPAHPNVSKGKIVVKEYMHPGKKQE